MNRSEIDSIIENCIHTAIRLGVHLPKWISWSPEQLQELGDEADGIREQGLGWKVIDFGLNDFKNCGLVLLVVCQSIFDKHGEPLKQSHKSKEREYPVSSFSKKFLFIRAGQTEPHHYHRQKERKELTVMAGGPVRIQLAWELSETALSDAPVATQIDGIWHHLEAGGSVLLHAGESITLPGKLSHIIQVDQENSDAIMLETSTSNNDLIDNIFPFMTPKDTEIIEDAKARYQMLNEHTIV